MPCFNAALFIREAIESVLKQTYPFFELIIVNDGSTDESESIIKSFNDRRIVYVKQENQGQCAACNAGYKLSSGSLIKFFDADDLLSPSALRQQMMVLTDKPTSIAYMKWARFYKNDVTTRDPGPTQIDRDCPPMEYLTWQRNTAMLQCGIWLFPRQLLEENGLWDERLSLINDTEFVTRILLQSTQLVYADNCELLYRTNFNSGTLSQTFTHNGLHSALLSIDLMSEHLLRHENSDRVRILIAQSYQMLREWAFPRHWSYTKIVEQRLSKYKDIKIHYRSSGDIFNLLSKFCGWKVARFFQYYYYLMRFSRR
ncbi:MAG: glycosyltransferase [Ferruginibacter sp.]|nr:glycosyltransferase [Ferruginibacter sp.]